LICLVALTGGGCTTNQQQIIAGPTLPGNNQVFPPPSFWLTEPAPSPFVNSTSFTVALPEEETLLVNIQTATGVIVRHLFGEMIFSGYHELTWDGKNDAGARCEVGFYYITAQAGPYRSSQIVKLQR